MRAAVDEAGVKILAPAKVNLFLEVLARRTDGYHAIETLMVAIDLCDSLTLHPRDDGRLVLSAHWSIADQRLAAQLGDIPVGSENIVMRALKALRDRSGVKAGATICLAKQIPSAAGLGGASSDAAAALVAANHLWKLGWPREQLSEVAAELGSDIPFFLGPPVAVCRGRGEIIEPLEPLPPLDVVVVRPPAGLSTPAVYKECRPAEVPLSVAPLVDAWRAGDVARLAQAMTNRLEPAAARISPWISRLREAFASQGCYGYQMSGSGSSYFGICRHQRHAAQVANRLRAGGLGFVMNTRTIGLLDAVGGERAA